MKSHLHLSMVLIGSLGIGLLAGCGGGNPDTDESDITTYTGAASVGDMAQFTVSGNALNYSLSGVRFGTASGNLSIAQIGGLTDFYQATGGSQVLGMMLSDNLGIAILPNVPDLQNPLNTVNAFVTGLANASNVEADIKGKDFLYVSYRTGPDAFVLRINSDNSFKAQRVTDYVNDLNTAPNSTLNGDLGTTNVETGCWRASAYGTYLNAVSSSVDLNIATAVNNGSCANFDFVAAGYDSNPTSTLITSGYYRFMIKLGVSRTGLVVDYADGSGFGVGLETTLESPSAVTATPATDQTYSVFAAPNVTSINLATLFNTTTGDSPFYEVVLKTNDAVEMTPMNCNYGNPTNCSTTGQTTIGNMDALYDTFCYEDSSNPGSYLQAPLPGMTCVFQGALSNPSKIYNALIDDQDGYFLAASLLAPEFIMGSK